MTKFQILGISAMIFILISYFRRFRQAAMNKIFIIIVLITGIIFFLYPELTNRTAHFLGIGRGADLIFYLAVLGFGYLSLILYSKIKKLEEQLAVIVRKHSLESVNHPVHNG
jgi:small membrane protein